ncbi:MAG: acyl-CoA thioesterase [Deltaproteobacteria bacterium]|nr:acyl-CoA thioesterase [Deltaproteobacteria bacterium]
MKKPTEIKIRGYHLDFYGHVNNARYLEFLEEARWEAYGNSINSDFFKKNGISFIVVNININYRMPTTMGQNIVIETSVKKIGNKSITLYQHIILKETDKTVADADVTFVLTDKSGKPIVISEELKNMFE